ncbi:MAG: sugar O-acyltransferase (sialic acid O-acetyltransferase NeuD family) [Planctomycetota bacterium]
MIWGAIGQAVVLSEFAAQIGLSILALVDNDEELSSPLAGVPLLRGAAGLERWLAQAGGAQPMGAIVAVGGARGSVRMELAASMQAMGLQSVDAVHPAAYVATDATCGAGLQVMAGAVVGARARLGQQCLINTGATVDHECQLDDGVHVGPGASLAGCVRVGRHSFVGTGAVVLPRIQIGSDVVVGAGAVVTRDLPDGVVVVGNPARVLRK